ncbi:MAG: glycosyltransferase family 4 protein, partial [Candidatus Peribacteraceae bacterium]|nr:glycosyltransferase family 4 protein [Candidatus Peribacteraceae bacterium]
VRPLTYFPERHLVKWCYRHASMFVVPSQFTKHLVEEYAKAQYRIAVIHNGVNFDRFQKDAGAGQLRKKYGNNRVLLTVGGLWGRKGHDLTLRALKLVTQKRKDVRYVMVGEGNGRPQLEALVRELGLQEYVEFAGRKSGDDLVRAYQAADIYVHTPKIVDLKFEGFGIVYLEASACGKPVVATDAGGVRDAVLDGETGFVVPDGDIPAVADRILQLMDDADLRRRMGESGRQYAKKNDWTSIAEKFVALYRGARA